MSGNDAVRLVSGGNPYLEALAEIPRGETRSFLELAALAGRPGAARAAGRALSQYPDDSRLPWHRVVASDGKPQKNPARDSLQRTRLRREGARPKLRESVSDWAKRVGARFVGSYRTRQYAPASDPRVRDFPSEQVEPFENEAQALARGFSRLGAAPTESEPLPSPGDVRSAGVASSSLDDRLRELDWSGARDRLRESGYSRLPAFLSPSECASILLESTSLSRFERSVAMLPKGFGVGSYHYYREPLPHPAGALRERLYTELAPLANELWPASDFPETLERFWHRCREHGQKRASSILICYGKGGVNHPHRDIYGRVWFPFQALVMLSKRGRDFEGGEFVLFDEIESAKPRAIPVSAGDVTIFVSRERFDGKRRIGVRHGMKPVTRGRRYGLGMVFHLAE